MLIQVLAQEIVEQEKTNYNNLSRKLGKILFYALVIAYVWMNFYYKMIFL